MTTSMAPYLEIKSKLDDLYVDYVEVIEHHSIEVSTKKREGKFPEYYAVGVKVLTTEELNVRHIFHWKNKKNIIYEGFNSDFFKVFLSTKTRKVNGKTCGFGNIRNFFDAVQFEAKQANTALPIYFYLKARNLFWVRSRNR